MENSKIEWTDHTFNPWIGCQKVSDGCKNCYAEQLMDKRYGKVKWGPGGTRQRTSDGNWRKPLQWNRQAQKDGIRRKVFCASLADIFEDRPELIPWRNDLFALIEQTPNLDWLLLTKRPENIMGMLPDPWLYRCSSTEERVNRIPPNVWLGTSVEDQANADKRIEHLVNVPARIRFLSCEPLLGPLDLTSIGCFAFNGSVLKLPTLIHWIIVGGESGKRARPMHPDWARAIRDQCVSASVPFFYKQWGEWAPGSHEAHGTHWDYVGKDKFAMKKVGKHAAGRLLDSVEWSEFPR